jgi:SAM-dependent methyltransferase
MSTRFIPAETDWIRSHYYDVPQQTAEFCGDIKGACILNLGCGEMLTDFGLLNIGVNQVIGLDLHERDPEHLRRVADKLRKSKLTIPKDYASRISYRHYDGVTFPFSDSEFDFIFSWSAFEHVRDVPRVLSEIHRVLRNDGSAFIQVYPWFHCFAGSHLSDYIPEPYFHLSRQPEWVLDQLQQYTAQHPENRDFILGHMYQEYLSLNKYSANDFYRDVVAARFSVAKARLISFDLDLSHFGLQADFSDSMICGTKMLLVKSQKELQQNK